MKRDPLDQRVGGGHTFSRHWSCDCCGTPATKRVAVVMDGAVAMVGSSCARKFRRARSSDLIRDLARAGLVARAPRDLAIMPSGHAVMPPRLLEDEFEKQFPGAQQAASGGTMVERYRWKGRGVLVDKWGVPDEVRIVFWDPYRTDHVEATAVLAYDKRSPLGDIVAIRLLLGSKKIVRDWLDTFPKWDPIAEHFKRARASDLIRSMRARDDADPPRTEAQSALLAHLRFQSDARKMPGLHRPKGFKYSSMEEYVLRNGRFFDSAPLTAEERERVFDAIDRYGRRFPIKQCYYNSQMLLLFGGEPGFRYVEGYVSSVFPILHGWLTLNDKVIDLTMRVRDPQGRSIKRACRLGDRVLGKIPSERAYIGVEYLTEDVKRHMVGTGAGGSLIDDWRLGYPLLREAPTENDHAM